MMGVLMNEFYQNPPSLENTYCSNRWLKAYLRHKMPTEMFLSVDADLNQLGRRCATEYLNVARQAEREKPVHVPFDPWGQRIDEIRVSSAWTELQNISAREGMVAIGYQRAQGEFSRLYQFAKLYLFHPSSAFFTCPLAMADGAAKVLQIYGKEHVHRDAYGHLTSTNPHEFWTSGQWMTERTGGSDVSQSSTDVRYEDGQARLYGTKWFSSATTSKMSLALGRCPDSPAGSRGLTLFFVNTYLQSGHLNHIRVLRLKDKLGTWALPTAELSLEGTYATQVGEKGEGIKSVASMLNITRLYNSVCSIGQSTRALESLRDYSSKRIAFGQSLSDHVLHYSTFAEEELKNLAGFLLTFELVHFLGKEENKTATANESELLRLLTPVCKLFTAKAAIQTASEVIEGFGGAGYCEDTGVPVHLRDAQVFPIWEGATNVLSLDLIRVIQKTQALQAFKEDVTRRLAAVSSLGLEIHVLRIRFALSEFEKNLQVWSGSPQVAQLASSRSMAFYLGRLYAYVLMVSWSDKENDHNQQAMAPWLEHFKEKFLAEWQPVSEEACNRSRLMWTERLKVQI
jgi:putative acyl-CoA dehydrogenase